MPAQRAVSLILGSVFNFFSIYQSPKWLTMLAQPAVRPILGCVFSHFVNFPIAKMATYAGRACGVDHFRLFFIIFSRYRLPMPAQRAVSPCWDLFSCCSIYQSPKWLPMNAVCTTPHFRIFRIYLLALCPKINAKDRERRAPSGTVSAGSGVILEASRMLPRVISHCLSLFFGCSRKTKKHKCWVRPT